MMRRLCTRTAFAAALAFSAAVQAQGTSGYVVDSRGDYVRSGFGLCWRTGYWTPALATIECDPDLVPKPAPVVVPRPAPSAAPAPAPAPAAPAAAPKPAVQPVTERVTLSADVLFEFDRAVLTAEGRKRLDDLHSRMSPVAVEVVIVIGHADRIGMALYNKRLSERRAEAVKAYLVSKGVSASRVYAEGKGETQPVTGDKCRRMGAENRRNAKLVACLQPDRRVEIEVVGTRAR
jgi:OmpA-OmpF porin, OOP family